MAADGACDHPSLSPQAKAISKAPSSAPSPDASSYPPRRDAPNTKPSQFGDQNWQTLCGANAPPEKSPEPLPPVGAVFFFRVVAEEEQPIRERPSHDSAKIGARGKGEVVRVIDFRGGWARLACDSESQVAASWQGWMLTEAEDTLLDEVDDPAQSEKEYMLDLVRRMWKINEHILKRVKDRTARAVEYLETGRVPPGSKELLPEGTRCMNAFWGLEARYIRLKEGEEYWPQGALTLDNRHVQCGWEQPSEESRTGHWRVFAARPFAPQELVEVCPLVPVDHMEALMACLQLRMNVVETPDDDCPGGVSAGRIKNHVPLGYGMLYQQSIELWDVQVNWKPVTNYNCKMLPVNGHMYIYATRHIQANDELILEYKRAFRTDQGESIDFTGFTPYWCRPEPPASFVKALATPNGPRKPRPVPGNTKFGRSKLHGRGVFAHAAFKDGEIMDICPCLTLDANGADAMQDYCFQLPAVEVHLGGDRTVTKREERFVLPLGNGAMMNHLGSKDGQNVTWYYDETTQCMVFLARAGPGRQEVALNEELCFDYGESYWDVPSRRFQRPGFRPEYRDASETLRDLSVPGALAASQTIYGSGGR